MVKALMLSPPRQGSRQECLHSTLILHNAGGLHQCNKAKKKEKKQSKNRDLKRTNKNVPIYRWQDCPCRKYQGIYHLPPQKNPRTNKWVQQGCTIQGKHMKIDFIYIY